MEGQTTSAITFFLLLLLLLLLQRPNDFLLQPRHRINQILHLRPRPLWVQRRVGPLPVPGPFLHQVRLQLALEHLRHVLAQHGEELVPVERAARGKVQTLGRGVRGDDEVSAGCECVPFAGVLVVMAREIRRYEFKTHQQMRSFL